MAIDKLNEDEQLNVENDFLKMKLMLESGAKFSNMEPSEHLPPEVENEFLKHIVEFERQWEAHKQIKVYDRIGRPTHFKPVAEIAEEEIGDAWKELHTYMREHQVHLDVFSPNISNRELYRFATEEFFEHEMDDISMPGMMHGFAYDEFHPDPVYDNTNIATDNCLREIFSSVPMEWMHYFKSEGLQFNQHTGISSMELKAIINRFKLAYDDITLEGLDGVECIVQDIHCEVKGTYAVKMVLNNVVDRLAGSWHIFLDKDEGTGYWSIHRLLITGINF